MPHEEDSTWGIGVGSAGEISTSSPEQVNDAGEAEE